MYKFKLKDNEQIIGIQEHEDGSQTVTYVDKDGKPYEQTYSASDDEHLDAHEAEVGPGQTGNTNLPVPKADWQVKQEEEEKEGEKVESSDSEAEEEVPPVKKAARKKTSLDKEPEPSAEGEE